MDRYEKALELARSYYDKDANTFLDTIFPELKESREEQIRKAIIKSLDLPFMEAKIEGTDVTYEEAVAWLEKQKHIEWSEEDEDMLNCCISSIEEAKENRYAYKETDGDTSYDREIDWLKSLRPVKQEWSEEDEKKIAELKNLIAQCNGFNKENRKKAFDMIDALRPHNAKKYSGPKPYWKPSEKQMDVLLGAKGVLRNLQYNDWAKILEELYEQLKQL